MKVRVHKDCGGKIVRGRCRKCGQSFGKLSGMFSREIKTVNIEPPIPESEKPFSARAYRDRIRNGKDIPRGGKD
jgi:hypothetical protein